MSEPRRPTATETAIAAHRLGLAIGIVVGLAYRPLVPIILPPLPVANAEDAIKRLWRRHKPMALAVVWLYASVAIAWVAVSWAGFALSGQLPGDASQAVGGAATLLIAGWLAMKRVLPVVTDVLRAVWDRHGDGSEWS
jgi:hypothetical protein